MKKLALPVVVTSVGCMVFGDMLVISDSPTDDVVWCAKQSLAELVE